MMQIVPYLSFRGACAAAFRFYEQALGGKLDMLMTVGDSPMADQAPKERHGEVMHAQLSLGSFLLMGGDAPPELYAKTQGITVNLCVDSAAEAERLFGALSRGGSIGMPLQETFWAQRFGLCTDRFGIPWMINYSQPYESLCD